ncbi:hypothetical protein Phi10:1_gp078 [Cellulophaga phage phi10:1]|uniref:Uncharacterized protein n=1 Tax=Cellulophaga phage phi10:1 TaxID=1327981 RepID=R9ZYJ4_9CAUD|nr:hypothetical protein Phi10:1_gp078 [Cellulophaga phage phi10:1]AGO48419.1 hypothetical protein Phi10:1_gp078 [Cellulophaga phage phi10:1]
MKVIKEFYLHETKKSYNIGDEIEDAPERLIEGGYVEAPKKTKVLEPKTKRK